jgi:murein DD-endopeptidase MepM/ murein hydrolase activator NlpD
VQQLRITSLAPSTLFWALTVWSIGCASASSLQPSHTAIRATTPAPPLAPRRPSRRYEIIDARVDVKGRVVTVESPRAAIDSRVDTLAREVSPGGIPVAGTPLRLVYAADDGAPNAAERRTLVAVEIGSGLAARRAFCVENIAGGTTEFYGPDGRPMDRALLRYPLGFVRITSGFEPARRHPVLKKHKPHLGVDFAAPRGTPVLAVGDGEVLEAGWRGGFGRLVRIAHGNGIESGYAHLDGFARGVAAGRVVRRGDVIGYVGRTGLATGPHLHFSLRRDGVFVDPLATELPERDRLASAPLRALVATAVDVETALALSDADPTRFASLSASASSH